MQSYYKKNINNNKLPAFIYLSTFKVYFVINK